MNRKSYYLLAILLCLSAVTSCIKNANAQSCGPVSGGIVGWWPGNNNAQDVIGGNNGTLFNGTTFAPGKVGQAFSFDGVDDRINVPDANNLKLTGSMTIEAWINVTAIPDKGMIFFRGDNRIGMDPYYLSVDPTNKLSFLISSQDDGIFIQAQISLGQWHHVAAVLDDATGAMKLYIDGTLLAQTTTTLRPFRDLDPSQGPGIGIGNSGVYPNTQYNFPFHGLIDELTVYNRALTTSEIQAIYNAGSAGKCTVTRAGEKIAFVSDRVGSNLDIYIMNADGTSPTRLTTSGFNRDPHLSLDGNQIVFNSNRDGKFEIYSMNADGSNQTRLTNNTAVDSQPVLSPDKSRIVFDSDRDGTSHIYSMNADGSNQIRLTNNSAFEELPAWSPDGSKIAFCSNLSGNEQIYVMNFDGTGQIRITNDTSTDKDPCWTPDGSHIVFGTNRDGNDEIYIMNADGSNQTRLTNNPATDRVPRVSSDGSKIAFETTRDGNQEIYAMNLDGSNQVNITNSGAVEGLPSWAPTASAAGTLAFDQTQYSVNESSGTATITVTRTGGNTGPVSVNYTTSDGTATDGADYTATTGTLTWSDGDTTPRSFAIPIIDDDLTESSETVNIKLSNPTGGAPLGNVKSATLTILDNDIVPDVSINDVSVTEGNNGATNAVFTVSLSLASNQSVTVNYATADGTAIAGSDYLSTNGTLIFNPGETTKTILVPVNGDTIPEPSESFVVNLSNASNGTLAKSQGVGTIVTDDLPIGRFGGKIAFVNVDSSNNTTQIYVMNADGTRLTRLTNIGNYNSDPGFNEDGSKIVFISNRDGNYEIYIMNADGTNQTRLTHTSAEEARPAFSPDGSKIVFMSNRDSSHQQIYVMNEDGSNATRLTVDNFEDYSPSFSPDGTKIVYASERTCCNGDIIIMNADGSNPTVTIPNPPGGFSPKWNPDGSKLVYFTGYGSTSDLEVTAATVNGTGITRLTNTVGTDQNPTWSPDGTKIAYENNRISGSTESHRIWVMNADGSNPVRITSGPGYDFAPTWAPGEVLPQLSINNASVAEGKSGAVNATFTVNLAFAYDQQVTVNYATTDNTATAGSDYNSTSGTLTFNPGETSKTITVPVLGDTVFEPTETFFINLTNASNASILNGWGTGTIVNAPPSTLNLSVATIPPTTPTTFSETAGANAATGTVTLDAASNSDITVNLSSSDVTAATVPLSVIIPAGQLAASFAVTAVDDNLVDGSQNATITARVNGLASASATVVVTDNETPTLSLSISPNPLVEGGAITGTVTRNTLTGSSLKVTLTSSDTTAATVPASITIPVGSASAQFTINGVDDAIADGLQSATITASATGFTGASVAITVADNDTPGIAVSPVSGLITSEAGDKATFGVRLTSQPTANVTISLSSSNAAEGVVAPVALTFTPANWNVTQVVTVTGVEDAIADNDQAYSIITAPAVSADSNYNGRDAADVAVLNKDNDVAALSLSLSANSVVEGGTLTGTVTRNTPPTSPLTVNLSSSNTDKATVPTSVVIPAGVATATFSVNTLDNNLVDGPVPATITATATGLNAGAALFTVMDNDTIPIIPAPTPTPIPTPTPPSLVLSFTTPGNGAVVHNLSSVLGQVAGGNNPHVALSIQRLSDKKYWSGYSWSNSVLTLPASVAANKWLLSGSILPTGISLRDGKYNLTATAADSDGQMKRVTIAVTVDNTSPRVSILNPPDKALIKSLPVINGLTTDTIGGSGISSVLLFLRRSSDGLYWTGTTWSRKSTALNTTLGGSVWVRRSSLPAGVNLKVGQYRLTVIAYDKGYNRATVSTTFTVVSASIPSLVTLSTATVQADTGLILLKFTAALNAEIAGDAAHYTVEVNGRRVNVESAGYNASSRTVILSLPDGALRVGDRVVVHWSNLQDTQNRILTGQTAPLVAK